MTATSTLLTVKGLVVEKVGALTEFANATPNKVPVSWGDPGDDMERTHAYVGAARTVESQQQDTFDGDRSERYELDLVVTVEAPGKTAEEVETVAAPLVAAVETYLRHNPTLDGAIGGLHVGVGRIEWTPYFIDQGRGVAVEIVLAVEALF